MDATALALVPVNTEANARFKTLGDELLYAWDRTDSRLVLHWSAASATIFGTSLKRRASNLLNLAWRLSTAAAAESVAAVHAYRQNRLPEHLGNRAGVAYASAADVAARVKVSTSQVADLVRRQPRDAVPQLLVLVATSIVVSGGPDGDGGAPDLDLMFGIDAHRSILSHSILMGAALETAFLSLVQLVKLLHAKLPAHHDPLWDQIANQADSLAQAASVGASLGMAYHLLVDGLVQPAAYHDLPMSMPMEAHQTVFVVNAAGEALDVKHKRGVGGKAAPAVPRRAGDRPERPSTGRSGIAGGEPAKLVEPPVKHWWETASAAELARAKELHRQFRASSVLVESFVADMLSDEELLIIERYGVWLEGLANGTLKPLTAAQLQFVRAAKREQPPQTAHEQAWVMYCSLLEYRPKQATTRT